MIELIFGSFVAGIVLTFTPCVLPMIPILSGVIVGQGEDITTKKAVMLSFAYVLGTAFTYTIMGALAGATGEQLQAYFQNVWVIGGMSFVFVLMALSMFGLFNIQLPSSIQSKLSSKYEGIKGGSLPMVFLLGAISALILGACVSPVLISFLGVAITKGDALLGAVMMFAMALGMGVPLIVMGFGAGKLLPKAGEWMNQVKYLFGVLLMAVAIELFSSLNLISELLLWGVFLIVLAVFLGATNTTKEKSVFDKVLKATGVLSLIWGTILVVGFAKGSDSLLTPLKESSVIVTQNTNTSTKQKRDKPFVDIHNMAEFKEKLALAKRLKKPMVIYFYTDYCSLCKKMKETTYKSEKIQRILDEHFVAIALNMSHRSDEKMLEVKKHFGIFGTPGFVFFDSKGNEQKEYQFYGYQDADEFFDTLDLMSED